MRKNAKFLALPVLIVALLGCVTLLKGQYTPPIPEKEFFEAKFKIHVCDMEKFQEVVEFYYGRKNPDMEGLTITIKESGEKIIFLPKKEDGTVDLETLGHEVFYHIMHQIGHG